MLPWDEYVGIEADATRYPRAASGSPRRGGVAGGDPRRHRASRRYASSSPTVWPRHRCRPATLQRVLDELDGLSSRPRRRTRPGAARAARRLQPPARRLVHLPGDPPARRACGPPHPTGVHLGGVRLARRPASGGRRRRQPRLHPRAVAPAGGHRRRPAQRSPGTPRRRAPGARDRPDGRPGADRARPSSTGSRRASRSRPCSATGSSGLCGTAASSLAQYILPIRRLVPLRPDGAARRSAHHLRPRRRP